MLWTEYKLRNEIYVFKMVNVSSIHLSFFIIFLIFVISFLFSIIFKRKKMKNFQVLYFIMLRWINNVLEEWQWMFCSGNEDVRECWGSGGEWSLLTNIILTPLCHPKTLQYIHCLSYCSLRHKIFIVNSKRSLTFTSVSKRLEIVMHVSFQSRKVWLKN